MGPGPPSLILAKNNNNNNEKTQKEESFFSACSKKIRIRHFVLFLAQYATLASDSFTVAMLAGKKVGKIAPLPP